MKHLIFALTVFGSFSAQAATGYSCTLEGHPGVAILMTPIDGKMNVSVGGQEQACDIEESPEVLKEVNEGFKANLDLVFDAETIVTCGSEVADGVIIYLIGKSPVNGMPMNTIVSNPVVGPMALSNCTKN